ncbi:substrate-binding domain-containing protein [Brevibacillus fluminis]|uniref:substrate-binding domain-containing protein n=1 Tax=Brevibacillus fluminis TaxID=511487 RepID=UPI003F8BF734
MSNEISYTTEEIAQLLRVSKLTVYDLIKKGELPAYRVGRQMRVDAADLEAYKLRSKGEHVAVKSPAAALPAAQAPAHVPGYSAAKTAAPRPIIISGQDICLDLLAAHIEKQQIGIRPLRTHTGSLNSLISMFQGESDVVSTHLLDADANAYNLPYIRKILLSESYLVVHVMTRWAGLYVQKGNPLQLQTWTDLQRPGLKLVNREKGSGARVLLDEQLRIHQIPRHQLIGYEAEETSHLGVASVIASGQADVGVGIEKAARLAGIDFVPLIQESYDLVLLKTAENRLLIQTVLAILRSEAFQKEVHGLGGYDISRMGTVLYETD